MSKWSDWSPCSHACKRGTRKRTRSCYDPTLFNEEENSCQSQPLVGEEDCLIRGDCEGSGYYLAQLGQSCDEFCESKGNQGDQSAQVLPHLGLFTSI